MTSLSAADWLHWPETRRLISVLGADSMRFVGGAVRDSLLGLDVSDIDVATLLEPPEVMACLGAAGIKTVPTGIDHGTVTAIVDHRPFEITTLRKDVATDGRRATVAFATDWREDAARRDFTINALYACAKGDVFDYFDGIADLRAGRVRFIGDAETRIREDALRILRFFRFHARFGKLEPDAEGLAACQRRANDLMTLSRERIRDELLKLLAVDDPVPTVELMINHNLFKPIIPEIKSVSELLLLVKNERRYAEASSLRRLAALLPKTSDVLEDVGSRLKLSNHDRKRLAKMVAAGWPDTLTAQATRSYIYRNGPEAFTDSLLLTAREDRQMTEWLDIARTWPVPKLPISGQDFIDRGLAPGPAVSASVRAFETAWIGDDFPSDLSRISALLEAVLG